MKTKDRATRTKLTTSGTYPWSKKELTKIYITK